MVAVHEDVRHVLVHGFFGVSCFWDVLDDDGMVDLGVSRVGVEDLVGLENVFHAAALGDFFGLELRLGGEVAAVIVAQVVVGDDGLGLDACTDQEVHDVGLDLGLATLEVIAHNEDALALCQLEQAGHECVLWGPVDEGTAFKHGGDGIDCAGGHFGVVLLNGLHEDLGGAMHFWVFHAEAFGVGGPQHDDLVQVVLLLEVTNVLPDGIDMLHLVVARQHVISSSALVGCNEVWVVDGREWHQVLHVGRQLLLQVVLEYRSTAHGVSKIHFADIPTRNHDITRVHRGKNVLQWHEDLLAATHTNLDS